MNMFNTVYRQNNKSRLGGDFWGLASSFLERVVIPSARISRDDYDAKIRIIRIIQSFLLKTAAAPSLEEMAAKSFGAPPCHSGRPLSF